MNPVGISAHNHQPMPQTMSRDEPQKQISFQRRFNNGGNDEADTANHPWPASSNEPFSAKRWPGCCYLTAATFADCYCCVAPLCCGIGTQINADPVQRTLKFIQWSGYSCCCWLSKTIKYDEIEGVTISKQSTPNTVLGTVAKSSNKTFLKFCGFKPKEYAVHVMKKDGRKIETGTAFRTKAEADSYARAVHSYLFSKEGAAHSPEIVEIGGSVQSHFQTCAPLCCFTVASDWGCCVVTNSCMKCCNGSTGAKHGGSGGR
ncbi:hypothetical protein TrLO_g2989 [Triparma laevis f. longispina]|uniref:Uncharacterized protein n=1 Tax=Triparma laevis f. longispina TaxID=1714387 RepID=A0A9W7A306_9STRA|nr:hypothetical protein TrLO_g2989 [Triparma laevis f. longispina]